MSLVSELTALKNKENTLRGNNAVTPFAYDSEAYNADDADGHADYVSNRHNNIPLADNAVIELNPFVTNKGLRKQASSFTRQLINHFCGRSSYNLNKTTDVVHGALDKLASYVGQPDGLAILDANGRIPSAQLPEDAVEYKGSWNAQTNSPHLVNGTGDKGDMYFVSQAGEQNLWDKLSWKLQLNSSQLRNNFVAMCYGNGTWLALENNSTLRYSTNDFKSISGGLFENNITDVCFYRGKYFYTKSSNAGSVIYYATDLAEAFPWASASNVPIHSLYCIRGDGNTLIAGGTEGIIKSSDEGNSWTVVSNVSVKKIAGYNGTWVACKTGGGLLISSDDGETWTDIGGATSGLIFVSIFANNGKWLASTEGQGVWESSGAETWTVISYIPEKAVCINVYSYDNIWVISSTGGVDETVTFKGIYVSYNNAVTWSEERLSNTKGVTVTCSREGIWLCSLEAVGSSDNIVIYRADFYPVTFLEGDEVVYNGSVWERIPVGTVKAINNTSPVNGNVEVTGKDLAYTKQYIEPSKIKGQIQDSSPLIYFANNLFISKNSINKGFVWSEDGENWIFATGLANDEMNIQSIFYTNGLWVAGTNRGLIWSEDGKVWNKGTTSSSITVYDIYYANGLWVAVSYGKGLWWSEDGKTWTQGTRGTSYYFTCVYFSNNLWIAGCNSHGLWYSSDGKAWAQVTGDTSVLSISTIYSVNGLWVISSNDGMWWSTDGVTWTQDINTDSVSFPNSINSMTKRVIYENALWVACSSRGIWWSTDGKNWTKGSGGASKSFYTVIYANNIWLAGSSNDGIWKSIDGKTWDKITGTSGISNGLCYAKDIYIASQADSIYFSVTTTIWTRCSLNINALCVYKANNLWVAGSENQGLWWSTDGKNWTKGTGGTESTFNSVYYAEGLWVATSNKPYKSSNGKSWSIASSVPSSSFAYKDVLYIDGLWVAVGSGIIWSKDGNVWTRSNVGQAVILGKIFYANGLWVAVGSDILYTSTTGKSYSSYSVGAVTKCAYYANGLWVIGKRGGLIWSIDGNIWETCSGGEDINFISIFSDGHIWVAGSENQGLWWSTDGKNWTKGTGGTESTFNSVYYAEGLWVAVGDGMYISINGKNWTQVISDNLFFNSVYYADGLWVAVGAISKCATIIASVMQAISYIKSKLGIQ